MRGWLHFIGTKYYPTPTAFIVEAEEVGITRRISVKELAKFMFGDRVVCAMKKNGQKTPVAFGEFRVSGISGLNSEVIDRLIEGGKVKECYSMGGIPVKRGCGSYTTGPAYRTAATIQEIAATVEEVDAELGIKSCPNLMVKGVWKETYDPEIRLKQIPFQRGFRRFDISAFKAAAADGKTAVMGQFYVDTDELSPDGVASVGDVLAEQVQNYFRA